MHDNSRLDYYLSAERDFPPTQRPGIRYLICTSPRCGSTVFGQMLFDTGCMGDPLEYLNPSYLGAYFRRFGGNNDTIDNVMARLQSLRTSPNGNFGLQLHHAHFRSLFAEQELTAGIRFLNSFDRVLFLRRRDRLRQATSLFRARKTGLWSSLEADFRRADDHSGSASNQTLHQDNWNSVAFDPGGLSQALQRVISQDAGWHDLLQQQAIEHHEIYYEDLVADWQPQCSKALSFLGVKIAEHEVPEPKMQKQSAGRDLLREQFLKHIGIET